MRNRKMVQWKIPLYKIFWDEDDVNAVSDVIKRGMYWTSGPSVSAFEKEVSMHSQKSEGVAFNSGTSALFALMKAMNIGPKNEVIVPSFTFIATSNCVVHTGAKPVFAEIEGTSYGLDPQDVEKRITESTKAIITVNIGGAASKITELKEIADNHDVALIEDSAESIGCTYNNKPMGSFGLASMFSFCGNKVMTTGEGGMIVTDDSDIAERLRLLRSHGRVDRGEYFSSSDSFDYVILGHNWRMSEFTAELGRSQLRKLNFLVEKRREAAALYDSLLVDLPLKIPTTFDGVVHTYQMYTVRFKNHNIRERVRAHLTKKGIMSKIYFECIHLTSYYSELLGLKKGDLPITEDLSERVLTLPIYPNMHYDDIHFVCDEIRSALS